MEWSFPRQVLLVLIVLAGLGWYPLVRTNAEGVIIGAIVGALLATANVLVGYATIEYAFDKSISMFFSFILGGMGVRLMLSAGLLVLFIEVFEMHVVALVASLGVCYVVFLVLELVFIHKKISVRQQG